MTRSIRFSVLLLLIFLSSLCFFLWGTAGMPVTDPVESNYALTAKEMVLSGDWVSPQIYGKYWYDKPALVYWMLSASYTLFGFTDFASRFPAALCGALSVVLMVYYMKRITGRRDTALWTGAFLATSLEFWIISHAIITDSMLFLFTVPALFSAYIGITEERALPMAIAYGAAGIACLAKGPVGLVLPGIILFLWCCTLHSRRAFFYLFHPLGILAFAAAALPWYVTMYAIHGMDFVNGFLGLHNVTRALASEHPGDNHFYYYLLVMPLSLLPWTGLSFYGMIRQWKEKTALYKLLFAWFWVTFLFYTAVATKYITYTYIAAAPAIAFAALSLPAFTASRRRAALLVILPFFLTMAALTAGSFFIAGRFLVFYVIAGISIIGLLFQWKQGKQGAIVLLSACATAAALSCIVVSGLSSYIGSRSSVEMAEYFHNLPGKHYFYGSYDASFTYYTGETAVRLHSNSRKEKRDARWDEKYTMPSITPEALTDSLEGGQAAYLFVKKNSLDDFAEDPIHERFKENKAFSIGTIYEAVKP